MPYLNKLMLIGHVGNVAISYSPRGTEIVKFSLAVNRKDGTTQWFNVSTFNHPYAKELQKGDLVFVEGELRVTEWENRTFIDVVANKVLRLRKSEGRQQGEGQEDDDAFYLEEEL